MSRADRELQQQWTVGEYCQRKGGCPIVYYVADTSETGVLVKPWKQGAPQGLGRWHSWKFMGWEFKPSAPELPLYQRFAGKGN